jgi:DNA-binding transcriptional LysR family regulator
MKLRNVDLNLLLAFEVLMRERHVSRAADAMFVTQSAMSHMLNRLRRLLDDPLFVRGAKGMVPTARALELVEPVRNVLRDIEGIVTARRHFEPSTARHRFAIGANDYVEYFVLPGLMQELHESAPGVDVYVGQPDSMVLEEKLEAGDIDIVLGFGAVMHVPAHLQCMALFQDRMVCMVRQEHPEIGDEVSMEKFIEMKHVLISSSGRETGLIDEALAGRGVQRRIGLILTHFLPAPHVVTTTDMVLSLPLRLARRFAAQAPLKILPVPIALPAYDVVMVWHPVRDGEPADRWLRDTVAGVAGRIAMEPV